MNVALFAAVVLRLSSTETPQAVQQLATVARSTADIRDMSIDAGERSIRFNGTPEQNAIAEWLVPRLDAVGPRPAGSPYKAGADDLVCVFYLHSAQTPQQLMEVAATARSLAEVKRAFVYEPAKAIVARGTAEQIGLMEWLVPRLDVAGPQRDAPAHHIGGKPDDIARVFYLNHTRTVQELQEMATVVRSITEIRRAFAYGAAKALALRAPADQIAAAEYLIRQMNVPAGKFVPDSDTYRIFGDSEGVVRVLAPRVPTVEALQQLARDIRTATGIRRAFTYNAHRALLLRGGPEQIAEAERLLNARQ
jgi:hypothetical protein